MPKMRKNQETGEQQPVRYEIVDGKRKQMKAADERAADKRELAHAAELEAKQERILLRSEIDDATTNAKQLALLKKIIALSGLKVKEDA